MSVHELTRTDARRTAVRAQLLDSGRPTDVLDVVRHLTLLQNDPTTAVAPSADLVLWSRLGPAYEPDELQEALDTQQLIELQMMVRPRADLRLYTAEMAAWPGPGEPRDWQEDNERWVATNEECRLDILERLRMDGPLAARELPDSCVVPWRSSGWTNNQNVTKMLDFLVARGEVATAGRECRERLLDLADRVYPDEPAVVEGVRGEWRVDPEQLGRPFRGRAALLSPLDRLVYDRKRMTEIFEFDYQLEMYKPAAKRRWGFWAMPILYGDRLVGKLDATADRETGVLRVDAVHEDVAFTKTMIAAVHREIKDLACWLELDLRLPS